MDVYSDRTGVDVGSVWGRSIIGHWSSLYCSKACGSTLDDMVALSGRVGAICV